jgi:predicted transcriptional regulator of viral defense system
MSAVSDYIRQLQGYEEHAFSLEELRTSTQVSDSTLRKELNRLSAKGEVLNLRKGFFLIVSPRYQHVGKVPIQLYVDKLFQFLDKNYYVGLYSAATFHGAAHQQIQQDYIITVQPALRAINKGNTRLHFLNIKHWPDKNIVKHKSDAGLFNVSSPALTAVDLVFHHSKIGGINRIMANLEELAEEIKEKDMMDLLSWYPHISAIQRLGYLLGEIDVDRFIINLIEKNQVKHYPILLSPKKGLTVGKTGNKWKVAVNLTLESDL